MSTISSHTSIIEAPLHQIQEYYRHPSAPLRMTPPWKSCSSPKITQHSFKAITPLTTEVTTLGQKREILYHHHILKEDMKHYLPCPTRKILISGASGFVGAHLFRFLPLFCCDVFTLVRRKPKHPKEIFWDPYKQEINLTSLEGFDAVIHLSGDNVAAPRWTEKKKRAIKESRLISTRFLVKCLNSLVSAPKTFLCASAVGFYGDCEGKIVDENTPKGEGFLAEVAAEWEEVAGAFSKGRVVSMRFGTVLGAQGGLVKRCLGLWRWGIHLKIGSGKEYCSWISLEDLGYQILHVLMKEEMCGAINMTSPYPATIEEFSFVIRQLMPIKWVVPISGAFLRGVMGEASELFISSLQAMPNKLKETKACFSYPKLDEALRGTLGLYHFF